MPWEGQSSSMSAAFSSSLFQELFSLLGGAGGTPLLFPVLLPDEVGSPALETPSHHFAAFSLALSCSWLGRALGWSRMR